YTLNREERQAVAEFLGTRETERPFPASAFCSAGTHGLATRASSDQVSNQVSNRVSRQAAASWNGWSPSPSNARYQTAEQAGLTAAEVPHLTLKWAFGFPGYVTAFASSIILNGTVFVGCALGGVQ